MPEPAANPQQDPRPIALAGGRAAVSSEAATAVANAISRGLRRAANKSRAPTRIVSGGGGFQARRGDRLFRIGILSSFGAFVALPVLVASIYWGLIASKQYVTEAKFALRSGETSMIAAIGGAGGAQAEQQIQDAQVVVKYVLSRAIVDALDKKIDLRAKFSRPEIDYFSRFDADDPIETLEKYWKKRVDASVDVMSGIISLHVRAFTPQDSLAITENLIELSEQLVNDMSTRSRRDALSQARAELTRAEERLKAATAAMRDARNTEGVIDAPAAAEAINKVITELRLELAAAEENLALQESAAANDSPQVKLLNARVRSLRSQIAEYSAQIASNNEKNDSLAGHADVLSKHQLEVSLAQQQYAAAATGYERARVDLESQRAYLSTFLRPTLAEKSIYPRRWLEWAIIVVPASIGWAILAAIAFLVRDHMAK
jgi:capsular polysaccharide transport system permease protein